MNHKNSQNQDCEFILLPFPVQAVIFDFDGVFTDNTVITFEDGREAVICNRSDGMGIGELIRNNVPCLVISTEKNHVVLSRCKKMGIPCYHGVCNKKDVLIQWIQKNNISAANVVYVGNDINDLECMKVVGCPVAVADCHPDILPVARIVLERNGGRGAVREICDLIIKNNNRILTRTSN